MKALKSETSNLHDIQKLLAGLQADTTGFAEMARILKQHAGINLVLNEKNLTLMATRLVSTLQSYGCLTYWDYLRKLQDHPTHVDELISAMTTNTTQFFRESVHFDFLKSQIVQMVREKQRSTQNELRIWCSAASTGQEIYTILMVLLSAIENPNLIQLQVLATDIDLEVLETASAGVYSQGEVEAVPEAYLQRYFDTIKTGTTTKFRIKREVRSLIRFAPFNLLTEDYPFQFPFDVIFCRNVLIYFDRATGERVVDRLGAHLRPGGLLFLGHSETGLMKSKDLKTVSSAAYQKAK